MTNRVGWYIAKIVEQIFVDSDSNKIYINYIMIYASSDIEAYEEAIKVGGEFNHGSDSSFIGINDIIYVGIELVDGTILFSETTNASSIEQVHQLVRSKKKFSIFAPLPSNEILGIPERPAYIPIGTEYYFAEIVESILINGMTSGQIVTMLVKADSPSEAFNKTNKFTRKINITKKSGAIREFIGIRDISPIHDTLEHGSEIAFDELHGLSQKEIDALKVEKEHLSIFRS